MALRRDSVTRHDRRRDKVANEARSGGERVDADAKDIFRRIEDEV